MLNIFTTRKVRSRMESGPMGPYLSAIAAELQQQGYARSSIRRHLRAADHFGAWLVKQGLSLKDISGPLVDRYLKGLNRQFSSSCPGGRLLHKGLGIPELVRFLQRQGVLQTNVEQQQWSPTKGWLIDFDHHLDQVAGNAQRTRHNYLRYARRFLIEIFGTEDPNWSRLQSEQITEFVRREASKLQPSSCGQPVTAIRALLRFLVSRGVVSQGLEKAVPPVLTWRHSSLPRYISSSEVERVIGVCNPATPLGLRERAVIVLVAHLGLRAGEVIRLKLDDIDWFEGRLIVRAGKNHRERSLPLSQEVGGCSGVVPAWCTPGISASGGLSAVASAFSAIAKFCHDYHVSSKSAKACRREGPPARSPHSPSYPGYADGISLLTKGPCKRADMWRKRAFRRSGQNYLVVDNTLHGDSFPRASG